MIAHTIADVDYRVEDLAEAAGVGVDTVRYYQGRKLLPAPRREGRVAWYGDHHLKRLREIRDLAQRGFTLAQIRELADAEGDRLLADLAKADAVDPTLDRTELARRADVPELIVDIAVGAGLLPAEGERGDERFAPDSIEMLAAARDLVSGGAPLGELTQLAMRHVANIESVIDDAIELFKTHSDESGGSRDELVATMHRLVPVASSLVGRHFERTLRSRALARLGDALDRRRVITVARRVEHAPDPIATWESSSADSRALWMRPDEGLSIVASGAAVTIEPQGDGRFTAVSAARVALADRVVAHGPSGSPRPVLVGGLSFATGPAPRPPDWGGFGDSRWVLPEITWIADPSGAWVILAEIIEDDADEADAAAALRARAEQLIARPVPPISEPPPVDVGDAASDDLAYRDLVARAVEHIADGGLSKVVLARTHHERPVSMATVLPRLRRRYPTCAVFAFGAGDRTFFGASPEKLVALHGNRVDTVALAGTVPRGTDDVEDAALAAEMLGWSKTRSEHGFVVDDITQRLATLGLVGATPEVPEVLKLARVQHLRTPISAKVERGADNTDNTDDIDVLRIASVLHPTPAVGGTPTEDALVWIREHESFDRGWYAAPVGWCDLDGNGELRVALRSALAGPDGVDLFAGAGIVADSVPDDELGETGMKLRALLDVMDR